MSHDAADYTSDMPALRLAPVLLWIAVIVALSSVSNPPNLVEGQGLTRFAHLFEYAILAVLLARYVSLGFSRASNVGVFVSVWIAVLLLGIADEWYQSYIPNRTVDPVDVFFDASGAALGLLGWRAATAIGAFRARRAQRPLATG